MGDPTRDDTPEPSLELPSLFRRKRRRTADEPAPEPERADPEPGRGQVEPQPEPEPEPMPEPEPAPEPIETTRVETEPLFVDEVEDSRPTDDVDQPAPAAERQRRATRTGPSLPAPVAAVLTGLVVGLGGAALTYGALQGCELVRGTDSCGAPGLLLLVAIVAVMVLVGTVLLAWFGVSDARSTSFLAVGIVCVVAMVALLEAVFSAWMFVAVPVIGAASYLVAAWVTSRFVEQVDDGPKVDVR